MWGKAAMDGTIQKLAGLMDTPPMGLLGVSACNDEEAWKYFIAVSSSKETDGLEEYTVPAATWAIFSGSGTNQSIQALEQRIIAEWLPTSGYEYANAPDGDCNPKCIMGYSFSLDGEAYQKCRYMAFLPTLSEENNPHIKDFLEHELTAIKA
jgi:hypothetical protein